MTDTDVRDTYVVSMEVLFDAWKSGNISPQTLRNQMVMLNETEEAKTAQAVGARERGNTNGYINTPFRR